MNYYKKNNINYWFFLIHNNNTNQVDVNKGELNEEKLFSVDHLV